MKGKVYVSQVTNPLSETLNSVVLNKQRENNNIDYIKVLFLCKGGYLGRCIKLTEYVFFVWYHKLQ